MARRSDDADHLRHGPVAEAIARERLIVVLRRIEPRAQLQTTAAELADAGIRLFEVTFDGTDAAGDLEALRAGLDRRGDGCLVGAGTLREPAQVRAAIDAGATFGVSPVLDAEILDAALAAGLPFVPGTFSPTEADRAWRSGATFVKLFPGSSLRPTHVRELIAPLPEIRLIVTGGIDGGNARMFLDAGAVAVGIGSALVGAGAADRRAIIRAVHEAGPWTGGSGASQ